MRAHQGVTLARDPEPVAARALHLLLCGTIDNESHREVVHDHLERWRRAVVVAAALKECGRLDFAPRCHLGEIDGNCVGACIGSDLLQLRARERHRPGQNAALTLGRRFLDFTTC